jgi:hypothetical protein
MNDPASTGGSLDDDDEQHPAPPILPSIMLPTVAALVPPTVSSRIVTLDVGGQLLRTRESTLTTRSQLFRTVLTNGLLDSPDTPLFVDRSPELFRHVLQYLRDPGYEFGGGPALTPSLKRDLRAELEYYGVEPPAPPCLCVTMPELVVMRLKRYDVGDGKEVEFVRLRTMYVCLEDRLGPALGFSRGKDVNSKYPNKAPPFGRDVWLADMTGNYLLENASIVMAFLSMLKAFDPEVVFVEQTGTEQFRGSTVFRIQVPPEWVV